MNQTNNFLDDELLDTSFDESDLEIYFMLNNVHVKEGDLVKIKGLNHKGDIIGMLPDEKSIYIN